MPSISSSLLLPSAVLLVPSNKIVKGLKAEEEEKEEEERSGGGRGKKQAEGSGKDERKKKKRGDESGNGMDGETSNENKWHVFSLPCKNLFFFFVHFSCLRERELLLLLGEKSPSETRVGGGSEL